MYKNHNMWLDVAWVTSVGIAYLAIQYFHIYVIICCVLGYSSLGALYLWFLRQDSSKPETTTECAICLEGVEEGEFVWCCQCKKTYHMFCAREWYKHGNKCPNCNKFLGLMSDAHWPYDPNETLKIGGVVGGAYVVFPFVMFVGIPLCRVMLK